MVKNDSYVGSPISQSVPGKIHASGDRERAQVTLIESVKVTCLQRPRPLMMRYIPTAVIIELVYDILW